MLVQRLPKCKRHQHQLDIHLPFQTDRSSNSTNHGDERICSLSEKWTKTCGYRRKSLCSLC